MYLVSICCYVVSRYTLLVISSPESEQSPSVMSHAAIEIKTIYKLETLTLEEEQSLGKLELDNKMNDNKRKRNLNSLLSEQRVQGAFQILKFVSTESKALIDQLKPWIQWTRI